MENEMLANFGLLKKSRKPQGGDNSVLKALAALPEDPGSIPSSQLSETPIPGESELTTICNLSEDTLTQTNGQKIK